MTSPSDPASSSDDDGAWGAETDFDKLEKEASKIFALWELTGPDGEPLVPPPSTPDAAKPAEAIEEAKWTAAAAPVAAAPVAAPVAAAPVVAAAVAPVAAAPVVAAPVVAAPVVAAPIVVEPQASVVVAPEPPAAVAPVVIAHTAPPAVLPDLPAAAPVRPSSRPPAMAAPVAQAAPKRQPTPVVVDEAPVVLPSAPPYGMIAAAAVTLLVFVGLGGWYMTRSSTPPPTHVATAPAAAPTQAPSIASAPPATSVAVATVAPVPAAVVAPAVVAPAVVAPAVIAPAIEAAPPPVPAPVVVAPPSTPQHRLRVTVTPSDAMLMLDGAPVMNPLDRQLDDGTHTLVASRVGFEPDTQEVDTSHDRSVQIRLHAVAPAAPPPPVAHETHRSTSSSRLASRVHPPSHGRGHLPTHAPTPPAGGRRGGSTLVTESPY